MRKSDSRMSRFQLIETDDGILEWIEVETLRSASRRKMKRGAGVGSNSTESIVDLEFENLPPSKITEFLEERDLSLTPKRGVQRINAERLTTAKSDLPKSGEALILVHGTFSNSKNLLSNFSRSEAGRDLIKELSKRYKGQLYTFDHPTLSVGPILNAMDLAREMSGSKAKFDFVAHSRGGLVCKWIKECIDVDGERCRKLLLAGSPLAGTGLAAPPNIRETINFLSGIGSVLSKISSLATLAVPIFSIVEALLKVFTSVTKFVSKTPLADAAMAMVPGLFSMSRVGNNPELTRLLQLSVRNPTDYFTVQSNFEPTDPAWKFWRAFRKDRLLNSATDVIFDGANDLVVDTSSMGQLGLSSTNAKARTLDFGTSETVHHLNYFQQKETFQFLRKTLIS